MQYNSTRNHKQTASPAEAVLRGIAPDGGLYLCDPAALPLDPAEMLQKDFAGMAEAVLVRRRFYKLEVKYRSLTPLCL